MIADYFRFSLKTLGKRKLRTWLTMIGIFIGIMAVVALVSLGEGMQNAIIGQFSTLGADKIIIQSGNTGFGPPGSTAIKPLTEHDKELAERVSGAQMAVGRLLRSAKIEFDDDVIFTYVASMPENQDEADLIKEAVSLKAEKGRLLKKGDKFKVVVGNNFASKERFSRKLIVGDQLKISEKQFDVVGVMKKTGNPMMDNAMLAPEQAMRDVFDIGDEYDVLFVQAKQGYDATKLGEDLKRRFRKDRGLKQGEEDFVIETPKEMIQTFNNIFSIVQIVIVGLAAISLIVGGVGITNTMYTSVLERTRDIGIMKSVGAKNSDVLLIFLIESGMLGMMGGIVGVAIGIGLAKGTEVMGTVFLGTDLLRASFPPGLIIGALLFSFIMGSLSGIMPARQAAMMNPVDALRFAK